MTPEELFQRAQQLNQRLLSIRISGPGWAGNVIEGFTFNPFAGDFDDESSTGPGGGGGGGSGGGGGHACCVGTFCKEASESICNTLGGEWFGSLHCSIGQCGCARTGCGFAEFIPSGLHRHYLTKTWFGVHLVSTNSCDYCGSGGYPPGCFLDYSASYQYHQRYDPILCSISSGVDVCSGSNTRGGCCSGGPLPPGLCPGGPTNTGTVCLWGGFCPAEFLGCTVVSSTVTGPTTQETFTNYFDTGSCVYSPGDPGNKCTGSRYDAIFLSDLCRPV